MTGYLVKMILCSGILLLVYRLFLEKEKMHGFNRFYLLFGILFSLVVPLIAIKAEKEVIPLEETIYVFLPVNDAIPQNAGAIENGGGQAPVKLPGVLLIYGSVTAMLLLRFARNLVAVCKKTRRAERARYQNASLLLTEEGSIPYSFLKYIFVNREDYLEGKVEKEILQHELAHVNQKHSIDIIFTELLSCFFWFNPFIYGYRKAIRLNHEFLADDAVLDKFRNAAAYQLLLLDKIRSASRSVLASPFNYLVTKKRLIMMSKKISPLQRTLRQIILLPLVAALVFLFSTKLVAQSESPKILRGKNRETTRKDTAKPHPWVNMSIGHTKEGVPDELMKEYQTIINKYRVGDSLRIRNITGEDRERLETIFRQMSLEQQSGQPVVFFKRPPPLPKVVPTGEQFNRYKNPAIYGVWIDGKKVPNERLDQYRPTDFSQVFVSKLFGAAKKGRTYTHQVNMMTSSYYHDYYKRAQADRHKTSMLVVGRLNK